MRLVLALLLLLTAPATAGTAENAAVAELTEVLAEGDIVLHRSRSAQSAALRAATGSPYTHVGLVFWRAGVPQVLEAVEPVRWTALADWLARGEAGEVVVLRLRDARHRAPAARQALRTAAEAYLGRPYDPLFQWDDARIYCSELVYKAHWTALGIAVGEKVALRAFPLSDPEVQALIQARSHGQLDLDAPVVAPASLLTDPDLGIVYSTDPLYPPSGAVWPP